MSTGRTLFGPAFARRFGIAWLAAGYVFLFLPIVSLLIFSFNNSPLPSVWAGFTLKWYAGLARDREMLSGLWLSLKVAFSTACASVVLGTLAAVTLVRYRRFTGRTLFSGMVSAPLVMPEVIVGLSLLLMEVALDVPPVECSAISIRKPDDDLVTVMPSCRTCCGRRGSTRLRRS